MDDHLPIPRYHSFPDLGVIVSYAYVTGYSYNGETDREELGWLTAYQFRFRDRPAGLLTRVVEGAWNSERAALRALHAECDDQWAAAVMERRLSTKRSPEQNERIQRWGVLKIAVQRRMADEQAETQRHGGSLTAMPEAVWGAR